MYYYEKILEETSSVKYFSIHYYYNWNLVSRELRKDKDAISNHCADVCNALNWFHKLFRFKSITDKKEPNIYSNEPYRECLYIKDDLGNSLKFYNRNSHHEYIRTTLPLSHKSIDEFESLKIEMASHTAQEAEFLKNQPEYSRMLNSRLLRAFIDQTEHVKKIANGEFCLHTITSSSIKNTKFNEPRENATRGNGGFSFCVYNGRSSYDDGYTYYDHDNWFDGEFRELSLKELSLLAVALSNTYPDLYGARWEYHISKSSEFKWYLVPYWISQRKPEPPKEKKTFDIY